MVNGGRVPRRMLHSIRGNDWNQAARRLIINSRLILRSMLARFRRQASWALKFWLESLPSLFASWPVRALEKQLQRDRRRVQAQATGLHINPLYSVAMPLNQSQSTLTLFIAA